MSPIDAYEMVSHSVATSRETHVNYLCSYALHFLVPLVFWVGGLGNYFCSLSALKMFNVSLGSNRCSQYMHDGYTTLRSVSHVGCNLDGHLGDDGIDNQRVDCGNVWLSLLV